MMPQPIRAGMSGTKMFAMRRRASLRGWVAVFLGFLQLGALGGQLIGLTGCRRRGEQGLELGSHARDRARPQNDLEPVRVVVVRDQAQDGGQRS